MRFKKEQINGLWKSNYNLAIKMQFQPVTAKWVF